MKYGIMAWGSDEYPNLIFESDTIPNDLAWKYPHISVVRLDHIELNFTTGGNDGNQMETDQD